MARLGWLLLGFVDLKVQLLGLNAWSVGGIIAQR